MSLKDVSIEEKRIVGKVWSRVVRYREMTASGRIIAVSLLLMMIILTAGCSAESTESNSFPGSDSSASAMSGLSKNDESQKPEKDSFDESTNKTVQIGNFSFSIPGYWEAELEKPDMYRAYAEKSGAMAMLQIELRKNDPGPSSYEVLESQTNNGNITKALEEWFDFGVVYEVEPFENGNIKGFLYYFDFFEDEYEGGSRCLVLPSEEDNSWMFITLMESSNTRYTYLGDFHKIIKSISVK